MIKVHGIEIFVFHACKCFPKCINLLYLATMLDSIVLYLFCSQKMCILCLDTCYLNAWLFNQVLLLFYLLIDHGVQCTCQFSEPCSLHCGYVKELEFAGLESG